MSRDVGVGQLVQELEQRGDRLPFEIGAFVALEACEGLLQESVKLEADDVRVTLEGSVVVSESAERAEPDEAARSLVSVLARLLVAAGPGVPPYLLQLVKDSTAGQRPRDLRHLHDAIEASLIPINRGASRRVLARLVRESDRPPAPEVPQIDPHELDAELDELLRDPAVRTLEPAHEMLPLQGEEDEEPITERIRIPREVARETDTGTDTASFDPEPHSDTLPVPPSEPAQKSASVPMRDLTPPPAPDAPAAAFALPEQPKQPRPEPITATIRKWQPPAEEEEKEETETASGAVSAPESAPESASETGSVSEAASAPEPESASETASETGSVSETVSVSESVSESATESENLTEGVIETELETATESVFGTGSVTASPHTEAASQPPRPEESVPAPEPTLDRPSLPTPESRRRRGGWGIWLLAAALGLGAYALITSGTLDAFLRPATPVAAPAPSGVIDVTVTPSDAQIFVFMGRGPAVAHDMTVAGAHEFVVFDQGLQPSRAIVPKSAEWTSTDDGPLYELAVQAQAMAAPSDALDLGAPQTEPASADATRSGTIRVITNPPGAKVYRFVRTGPTARIQVPSIHEGQELLVYHPGHQTRRAVIGPSDWQAAEGSSHLASVEVQLPPLAESTATEAAQD